MRNQAKPTDLFRLGEVRVGIGPDMLIQVDNVYPSFFYSQSGVGGSVPLTGFDILIFDQLAGLEESFAGEVELF